MLSPTVKVERAAGGNGDGRIGLRWSLDVSVPYANGEETQPAERGGVEIGSESLAPT